MTASRELYRGSIVLVRLDPTEGREIRKTRPAVVVSNEAACRADSVIQVVPLTGLPERSLRPYEARVESPPTGLTKPSRAMANQIRTVARHRVVRVLGRADTAELHAVIEALRIQLGI